MNPELPEILTWRKPGRGLAEITLVRPLTRSAEFQVNDDREEVFDNWSHPDRAVLYLRANEQPFAQIDLDGIPELLEAME